MLLVLICLAAEWIKAFSREASVKINYANP